MNNAQSALLSPFPRVPCYKPPWQDSRLPSQLFSHILVVLLTFLGELFSWAQVKYDQKVPAWADEYALKSVFRGLYEILHYLSNVPLAGLPIPRHFAQAERGWVFTWRSDFLWNKASAQWAWIGSRVLLFFVGWDLLRVKTQLCWVLSLYSIKSSWKARSLHLFEALHL